MLGIRSASRTDRPLELRRVRGLRTLRIIKDALDPTGVLAPGKQGVWPSARPRPSTTTEDLRWGGNRSG